MDSFYQFTIAIFFVYFVMIVGMCNNLLTCGLQKYINESIWIKHFLIFLSIYFFTFIFNWYQVSDLIKNKTENFSKNNQTNQNPDPDPDPDMVSNESYNKNNVFYELFNNKKYAFLKYLLYTIIIYVIFIISTKNETWSLLIFLFLFLVMTFVYLYIKSLDITYTNIDKLWISQKDIDNLDNLNLKDSELRKIKTVQILNNSNTIVFSLSIIILFIGFGFYLSKQMKIYPEFNIIKFLFGTNKCENII